MQLITQYSGFPRGEDNKQWIASRFAEKVLEAKLHQARQHGARDWGAWKTGPPPCTTSTPSNLRRPTPLTKLEHTRTAAFNVSDYIALMTIRLSRREGEVSPLTRSVPTVSTASCIYTLSLAV